MKKTICIAALSASMLALSACGKVEETVVATAPAAATPEDVEQALDVITQDGIWRHLEYLASDELKGRMTGSPEYEMAAAYVAKEFEEIGLEPAGDEGWMQQVPMLAYKIDPDSAKLVFHMDGVQREQRWKEDYVMGGDVVRDKTTVTAEVVYLGYGVHAPDAGYSDYEGIDVTGKIVAVFSGAPDFFDHNERAYYSSSQTKYREAVARGAVGYLSLRSRQSEERYGWDRLSDNAGVRPGMSWLNLSGDAANYLPELKGGAVLNVPPTEELFSRAAISFEDARDAAEAGKPLSTPLGVEITMERQTTHETITSPNVIGVLRGSDPELANEFVVYTAHLDHVGEGSPVDGDSIYNGMYDNAMGSAILIETARAFAALPVRPKRSIMFLAVTGEERGLIGSDYFAHYPTVPSDSLVANVNLDMPILTYPVADLVAFGAEHSSLQGAIERAVEPEGMTLSPDPMPEEVLFVRSDQYSFVKQGVPAVFLVTGYNSTDPEVDGKAMNKEFTKDHYHRPSDDLSRPIHWPSALRFSRANMRIGYTVSEDPQRPTWNEGDFFGEKFARKN
ncbi:MAG: M28 family metallopeptidase [Woeseiaceae bacterium]